MLKKKKKKERTKKASTGEINIILRGLETNSLREAQSLARYWWLVDTLYKELEPNVMLDVCN